MPPKNRRENFKKLVLLRTGQHVIDLGEIRAKGNVYREVLVPYTEQEFLNRSNLNKRHHRLIIRIEKLESPKEI